MKKIINNIMVVLTALVASCSSLPQSDVYSQQTTAEAFIAKLNSSTLQTITIQNAADSEIAWAKLDESEDFKYFQIEKVTANGEVIVQDGVDDFVANSRVTVPEFSVSASEGGDNGFDGGSLDVSTEGGIQFTVRFAPQAAQIAEDRPYQATLEIYYKAPREGLYLVNLEGYVQGIQSDKCSQSLSTYTIQKYDFVDGKFGFYMCSPEVAKTDNANVPEHGASTNFTEMPIAGNFYTYQPDDETLCLMHADNAAGPDYPSLPDFDFLIPEGLAEVDSLPLSQFSTATCSIDADGIIFCEDNLKLDTLISLAPMTVTNGPVAAEELVTSQCPDFDTIAGSGTLDDDEMTLITYGTILPDTITETYNISDAVVVGEINLKKAQ